MAMGFQKRELRIFHAYPRLKETDCAVYSGRMEVSDGMGNASIYHRALGIVRARPELFWFPPSSHTSQIVTMFF